MSVRRLADASVQPASFAFTRANAAWARQTIKKYPAGRQASAVIPLLMRAQEQEGWVTRPAIESIAEMLDMPFIRVLEVATFYTQYQLKPVGTKAHVQVCGTTPCMLRGSEALMDVCRSKIHPEQFHTNEDGTLSWEEVECLGACVNAPMVMIFKDTYEDLTPERLEEIIDAFEAGKGAGVPTGPQNGRMVSAPTAGLTSLKDEKAVLKATRDREARASRKAAKSDEAVVPPSRAAKPKTRAPETDPSLRSPSPKKSSANGEKKASVEAPKEDRAAADRADPEVEGEAKKRAHPKGHRDQASKESPEELRGEPIGPAGKRRKDDKRLNPTMAVATTASGVAERDEPKRAPEAGPVNPTMAIAGTAKGDPKPEKGRPAGMDRPERPDDLKMISGVGPRIEGILNELGIYTYGQVAAWKKAERDWVDQRLKFHGRIEREDWVRQAKALAKGGPAEYERVFGKKPR
ncbi:MAG: NADH-quinone oxidoreductase subunit NuoE [Rhizobiaceae bacterium]|nr:NADH-quinone oxidoreductase subunit NuoE [Rhizobiaceae bacterium]MCV0408254.1 NADH-quinone oxidoreductase subunit NuoE [Rhizobiaceae bacterium]